MLESNFPEKSLGMSAWANYGKEGLVVDAHCSSQVSI